MHDSFNIHYVSFPHSEVKWSQFGTSPIFNCTLTVSIMHYKQIPDLSNCSSAEIFWGSHSPPLINTLWQFTTWVWYVKLFNFVWLSSHLFGRVYGANMLSVNYFLKCKKFVLYGSLHNKCWPQRQASSVQFFKSVDWFGR